MNNKRQFKVEWVGGEVDRTILGKDGDMIVTLSNASDCKDGDIVTAVVACSFGCCWEVEKEENDDMD